MAAPLASSGNPRRILATLGVLGAIGALATVGTYSLFTDFVNGGPQTISSGTLDLAIGGTNTLAVPATNIAPTDTIQRVIDLTNSGNINFASVTLTTTASPSSVLDTDTTNGLQMNVDACSVAWTPAGASYTCGGTQTALVASRPVIGSNVALGALASLTTGGTDRLRVTLTLPGTADNTFQTKTSTITYRFDATQRAGTAK